MRVCKGDSNRAQTSMGTNKVNSNLEFLSVCFILAGHLQTSDQWPAARPNLIKATYPQAEGLQVQVAQRERDGEEGGGGVNTAQTRYSEANHTGWHINIVLKATAVSRLCYTQRYLGT